MEDYSKPLTKQCMKKILEQMENSIYKIKGKDKKFGIAFFSKIKIRKIIIPIILTNYRIIDEQYIQNNNGIEIQINNKLKKIRFNDRRFKYINKEYDLTVIEIKESKKIKINFFDIDEAVYLNNSEMLYNKESIYIMHNNNENEISISLGKIKYLNTSEIICFSNKIKNDNISPIFNLSNNKLIGILKSNSKYYIKGLFLKLIINEFINLYKANHKMKNEIDILVKVEKKDINKEIYFLNKEYSDYNKNHYVKQNDYYNLKELNEFNTELSINGKIYKYNKYFNPDKEGEYKIKLRFDFNLTNCAFMFNECINIIELNLCYFKTKYITNMHCMFFGCVNLKKLNFSSFNTKNVINMSYMFCSCTKLIIIFFYIKEYIFFPNKIFFGKV